MALIKVVRLEKNGRGIFRPQEEDKYIYDNVIARKTYDRHNGGNFPLPQIEGLDMDKYGKTWFCAYKTVEQLQDWILKEELDYFISQGFKVLLLSVEDFQVGDKQVIFLKETIKSSEDITTLFA